MYDVIIIGLGAMGSAAAYQSAKTGQKVLGLDQYAPPHAYGSSHGDTRITRVAIGEGAAYTPLVQRSHAIWQEIEQQTGTKLLHQTGGLTMSVADSQGQHGVTDFVEQVEAVAEQYGIAHEMLSNEQIRERFPQFGLTTERGYYEPESGYLLPEKCVETQLELAKNHGAEIKTNEKVVSWESADDQVTVRTINDTYTARKLIVTAGPWINELLPGYDSVFKIYRQVLYWFAIEDKSRYELLRDMPVYIWIHGTGADDMIYGFPAVDGPDGGIKVAAEQHLTTTSPEELNREVSQDEIAEMYTKHVKGKFPGVSSNCVKAKACMYTVTPDHGFVIDFHPNHQNVIVASPCSGHGFKHSAAIGEVLSQLAIHSRSDININEFKLERFYTS